MRWIWLSILVTLAYGFPVDQPPPPSQELEVPFDQDTIDGYDFSYSYFGTPVVEDPAVTNTRVPAAGSTGSNATKEQKQPQQQQTTSQNSGGRSAREK
ncbi:unnamed protein product, partial [Allacma fusca]